MVHKPNRNTTGAALPVFVWCLLTYKSDCAAVLQPCGTVVSKIVATY